MYKSVFIRPIRVIGGPSSQEPTRPSDKLIHGKLTEKIIGAYYHVYNTLGYGFLEKVYENALAFTLRKDRILVNTQVPVNVYFEGQHVGIYFADLIVANCVIIEAKAAVSLCSAHEAQLLNYLKATPIEVGLLLNFGEKPEFRRKIFSTIRSPIYQECNPHKSAQSVSSVVHSHQRTREDFTCGFGEIGLYQFAGLVNLRRTMRSRDSRRSRSPWESDGTKKSSRTAGSVPL